MDDVEEYVRRVLEGCGNLTLAENGGADRPAE